MNLKSRHYLCNFFNFTNQLKNKFGINFKEVTANRKSFLRNIHKFYTLFYIHDRIPLFFFMYKK